MHTITPDEARARIGDVIAAEGSALNMTNGVIMRLRQQQFDAGLAVLGGATAGSPTYDSNGADGGDHHRRSLAEA